MNNFSILEVDDPQWEETLSQCELYDFHHTSCYHKMEELHGQALLFVASNESEMVAMPLILRDIPGSQWKDCTSSYGYSGPVSNQPFHLLSHSLVNFFWDRMLSFFHEMKVVTAFSRLHPLIENQGFFSDYGRVRTLNQTVNINLELSLAEQRKQYRKSNKPEINKLRRSGFQIIEGKSDEDVNQFFKIYHENMERVNAKQYYFFSRSYIQEFICNPCFGSKLLLAKKDDQIAAGAIFTITNNIMQYHLAGTKEEFVGDAPMKLILDEARHIGTSEDLRFLHLGGGVGGSDEDSLFRFKSGFSKERGTYRVWQMVINTEAFNELNRKFGVTEEVEFFPPYRMN